MGLTYDTKTSLAVTAKQMATDIAYRYYPDLKQHEVTICVALAYNLDDDGAEKDVPPLMDGDYRILAKPGVVNLLDRSDSRADVQILLDGHHFKEELPDADREAILDGAIAYFEIQQNEDGTIKTDSAGRPKLKLRSPDWQLKGFVAVVRRHGDHAIEAQAARRFQEQFGDEVLRNHAGAFPGDS